MKDKMNSVGFIPYCLIVIAALLIHLAITIKTGLTLKGSLLLAPIPFAWAATLSAVLLLLWSLLRKGTQKGGRLFPQAGAFFLSITSAALLIEWLILLSQSGGNRILIEELLFPLFLFSGLCLVALFSLWKGRGGRGTQFAFLCITPVIFILPRESGDFTWNWYNSKLAILTQAQNNHNTNAMNWGDQSIIPGEHGAAYTIQYSGVVGPVGNLLSKRYSVRDTFPENAATVIVSGTVQSPGVGVLFPLLKWGKTEGRLVVNMHYLKSNLLDVDDMQSGQSLSFTAVSIITFEMKQRFIGISSIREFHSVMADEIHQAVIEQVEKELNNSN